MIAIHACSHVQHGQPVARAVPLDGCAARLDLCADCLTKLRREALRPR